MLGSMSSDQILKIISRGNTLRFGCPEEILHDRICVISKGDLDWAIESMNVAVVARTLVGLVLLHKRDQLLGSPALALEIVIIRSRCARVHHEINGGTTAEDVCTWYNSLASSQPFTRSRVIE